MLMGGLTKDLTLLSPCSFSAAGLADRALTVTSTLSRAAGFSPTAAPERICSAPSPPDPFLHRASPDC